MRSILPIFGKRTARLSDAPTEHAEYAGACLYTYSIVSKNYSELEKGKKKRKTKNGKEETGASVVAAHAAWPAHAARAAGLH